jgi:hypothetical protein
MRAKGEGGRLVRDIVPELLSIGIGNFTRGVRISARGARRNVTITECRIISGGEIQGKNFYNDLIEVYVDEVYQGEVWEDDAERIGSLILDRGTLRLSLISDGFQQFWMASEATDGATRTIQIGYWIDDLTQQAFAVTEVGLWEKMPKDAEFEFTNPKTGRLNPMPPREHPVVAEMRAMTKKFSKAVLSILWFVLIIVIIINASSWIGKLLGH